MGTTFKKEIKAYKECPDVYKENYQSALVQRRESLKNNIEKMKAELNVINKVIRVIEYENVANRARMWRNKRATPSSSKTNRK